MREKEMKIKGKKGNSRFEFLSMRERFVNSKRSQVTIFIILAIVIVIVLIVLFFPDIKTLIIGKAPIQQFEDCLKEPVEQALELVSYQGGYINPENYISYKENNVAYLCYTEQEFEICTLQEAFIKNKIETEIQTYVEPQAKTCINSLKSSLQQKGCSISMSEPIVVVSLVPNGVYTEAQMDLTITKKDTVIYDRITNLKQTRLYSMAIVTNDILKQELEYGDTEILGFMDKYPYIEFEKTKMSDGSNVYELTYRNTKDKFMFATKNLLLPEGY